MGLIFTLTTTISFAQRVITGTVTGQNNQPTSGATVTVTGTTVATQTDAQGNFTISVPANRNTLTITYVGFETQTVNVSGAPTVSVSLSQATNSLTEVVITGYTAQARKDITGSVSVVRAEDLKSVPAASAEQQLQGRAAGVTVTSSGIPGAGATVRIRGFGSFSANGPLYIIDGVPGSLNGINPNDIESMQVLKDAASASIYGARASNGVIVVTTKKGRQGEAKVSYNTYFGWQNPGKGFTNLLNPQETRHLKHRKPLIADGQA